MAHLLTALGHDRTALYAWGAPRFLATHLGAVRDALGHERARFHAWPLAEAQRLATAELSQERTARAEGSDQADYNDELDDARSELGLGSRVSVLWPCEQLTVTPGATPPRARTKTELDNADDGCLRRWCDEAGLSRTGRAADLKARLRASASRRHTRNTTAVSGRTRTWFTACVVNRLGPEAFTLLFDASSAIDHASGRDLDGRYQRVALQAARLIARDEWPQESTDLVWCRGTHRDVGTDEARWPLDPEPLDASARRAAFAAQRARAPPSAAAAPPGGGGDGSLSARALSAPPPATQRTPSTPAAGRQTAEPMTRAWSLPAGRPAAKRARLAMQIAPPRRSAAGLAPALPSQVATGPPISFTRMYSRPSQRTSALHHARGPV